MASVPLGVSVMRVVSRDNMKTSLSHISNVSSGSSEPSDLLERVSSEWSDNTSIVVVCPVVSIVLNGDSHVSVGISSDGSGSPVEDEPLSVVVWIVVVDSESILA